MSENLTRNRMIKMLIVVGVVLGAVFGFKIFMGGFIKKMISGNIQPQTVSTTVAKTEEWQQTLSAVGSLRAVRGADLAFEVSGIVEEIEKLGYIPEIFTNPKGRPGMASAKAWSARDADEIAGTGLLLIEQKLGAGDLDYAQLVQTLRAMLAAEKPLEGELSLIAPNGSVAAASRERRGGPRQLVRIAQHLDCAALQRFQFNKER